METETPHKQDSAEVAVSDLNRNMSDNRATLTGLFDNADAVASNQSAHVNKLFPDVHGTREYNHPLLKAAKAQFMESVSDKDMAPLYKELAFQSFCDEIEKIAFIGIDDIVGGAIGYRQGQKQHLRGEKHNFGGKQLASLLLPGGAGYQVGRYFGHDSKEKHANRWNQQKEKKAWYKK
jgi:hypothetical protein